MSKHGRTPETRAYELVYPDGPLVGLPSYVGWGVGAVPWQPRWALRSHDGSRLGAWFRELDARRLHPVADWRWLPSWPMGEHEAVRVCRWRLAMIEQWAGQPAPSWLLNTRGRPAAPNRARRPVTRLRPDGTVEHYRSIYAAAAARGVDDAAIVWCLTTGCSDREGGRWVEALAGVPVAEGANKSNRARESVRD